MTSFSTQDILDLDPIIGGQVTQSFVFDLLDADHNVVDRLDVSLDSVPSVRLDTQRSIMRTCSGLVIDNPPPINIFEHRIRPSLLLSNGEQMSIGVFMLGDDVRAQYSWGERFTPELFDETFLVDQPLATTVSVPVGGSILNKFRALAAQVGLADVDIDVDDVLAAQALVYKVGSSRHQMFLAFAALLGCYPPFFDNDGVYTVRQLPNPNVTPDHEYASGTRVIEGSTTLTNSVFRACNLYIASGDNPSGSIVGRYKLPAAAPNSIENTGRVISKYESFQGLATQAQADRAAYGMALQDRQSFVRGSMTGPPDPRHGAFDVVELRDDRYLEVAWEMKCSPGGEHTHELVRFWEPDA